MSKSNYWLDDDIEVIDGRMYGTTPTGKPIYLGKVGEEIKVPEGLYRPPEKPRGKRTAKQKGKVI